MFSILVHYLLAFPIVAGHDGTEPGSPPETLFSEPPALGGLSDIGVWPVALFARQQQRCTDPAYSVQCAALIEKCCQSDTYCCPDNLPFCCEVGDTCQIYNGKQGCCPNTYETCDGRQCSKPGSVCCNDYNHTCRPNEDCCKDGCCFAGSKCCIDVCCGAGKECCPSANGGTGGCCWPGMVCCGDHCCDPQSQYCSNGVCINRATPTVKTTTTDTIRTQGTGAAGGLRDCGRNLGLMVVPLGVAFELCVGF